MTRHRGHPAGDRRPADARRHGPERAPAAAGRPPGLRAEQHPARRRGGDRRGQSAAGPRRTSSPDPLGDPMDRPAVARRPPARSHRALREARPRVSVTCAGRGRRDPARRGGGRHHQHRGGLGHADHVPDPARVRRPPGDRQRLQHHRAGARARRPGRSATGRELVGQRSRWSDAWCRRRWSAVCSVRVLLLVLPAVGVRRDRAGADRARRGAGGAAAADLGVGRPRATRRVGGLPTTARWWVWPAVLAAGVYGGYFGAAQGVLLMAVLGIGVADIAAAAQRHQERARRWSSTGSRRWSSSLLGRRRLVGGGADRRRLGGRWAGRRARRPPAAAPRAAGGDRRGRHHGRRGAPGQLRPGISRSSTPGSRRRSGRATPAG